MPLDRYASILDVHVILRRGGKILLLRRAEDTYASGQLCLPSWHMEEGESVLAAAVRETPTGSSSISRQSLNRVPGRPHQGPGTTWFQCR